MELMENRNKYVRIKFCNFAQVAKLDSSMINDFTLSLFSVILCRQGLIIF